MSSGGNTHPRHLGNEALAEGPALDQLRATARAALGEPWDEFNAFCQARLEARRPFEPGYFDLNTMIGVYLSPVETWGGQHGRYDASPRWSFPFAWTGGDGEHYSVLLDPVVFGVVVLTSPMASFGDENLVVGENFREFLELGCQSDYSTPANLCMIDMERCLTALAGQRKHDSSLAPEIIEVTVRNAATMAQVREQFRLSLWSDIPGRLEELNDLYGWAIVTELEPPEG